MGILRVNKVSGLEAPTPVTGSVSFDGSGDALTVPAGADFAYGTGDFTVESWVYQASSTGFQVLFAQTVGGTNYFVFASNSGVPTFYSTLSGGGDAGAAAGSTISATTWNHIAVTRQSGTVRVFVNGIAGTSVTNTTNLTDTSYVPTIGAYTHGGFANGWNGYISNLRVLKGTALYTENFTPPVNELQPIGDTVLLCCNNSTSVTAEATGKTITANGNAVASTFSPGLTRDFTYGTQFSGVTRFDTQGYFVPPSGNTQNRYTLGLDEIVTSGLVLHLDAGNPFSYPATGVGTKWTDLTHTNNGVNNLILYSGPTYNYSNRGFLSFDGVNAYAEGSCNSIITNPTLNNMIISVNFWCNVKTSGSYYILSSGAQTSSSGIAFSYQAGTPFYSINGTNSGLYRYFNVSDFPLTTWINWCFSSNGTTSILYKNGIQLSVDSFSSTSVGTNFNTISIGRPNGIGSYLSNMDFSSLSIYNRALSAAEVSQNYSALRGRFGI